MPSKPPEYNPLVPCECGRCGQLKSMYDKQGRLRRFIHGHQQFGENNPIWKGGRKKHDNGYIMIRMPEHPYADKHGYIMEHRLVVERLIGRYLTPNVDDVHHRNGIKDDNRPENLELISHSKHSTEHMIERWQRGVYGRLKSQQSLITGFM